MTKRFNNGLLLLVWLVVGAYLAVTTPQQFNKALQLETRGN